MRVALKSLTETQIIEDVLKQVKDLTKNLMACNQELKYQLAEES
jgi:hypothetical protein